MRQLPNDINAEACVLSAMMLDETLANTGIAILSEDKFYRMSHKIIFNNIKQLIDANEAIDITMLIDKLKTNKQLEVVGSESFINELSDVVLSGANIENHAKLVEKYYLLRELITSSNKVIEDCFSGEMTPKEIAEQYGIDIDIQTASGGFKPFKDTMFSTLKMIEELQAGDISQLWVRSYLPFFDNQFTGFKKKSLNILAARPAMGKTSFLLNLAQAQAENGVRVGISELEMGTDELQIRMISAESGVPSNIILKGEVYKRKMPEVAEAGLKIAEYPIYVDETAKMTINSLRASYRTLIKKHGKIDIWYIDYLQLLDGNGNANRNLDVGAITRGLKILAKEEDIPIVALSQLNRGLESRRDKFPRLADLRESGSIEQDADVVLFLMRPFVYVDLQGKDLDTPVGNFFVDRYIAFLTVGKCRHSAISMLPLRFDGGTTKFSDWDNDVVETY